MKEVIERITGASGELQLQKEGSDFEIISGGIFLMSTDSNEGEREMVRIPLEQIRQDNTDLTVLVGGLGMGYSVQEALKDERVSRVDVVELEEAVIRWNKTYFTSFNGNISQDSRVNIICDDFFNYIKKNKSFKYDLVVLDVDNGPDWIVRQENEKIYQSDGMRLIRNNMSPGGMLSVWSATLNSLLKETIQDLFFYTKYYPLELVDPKGRKYHNYLYFGCKPLTN